MTIEQHIEELRMEFSACDDAGERAEIETELQAARTQLMALEQQD